MARQHRKHDVVLSIMIEDCKQYLDAVQYIYQLSFENAEKNIGQYGAILMQHCPNEMNKLLKTICTNYVESTDASNVDDVGFVEEMCSPPPTTNRSDPNNYIHFFGIDSERMIDFLEHLDRNGIMNTTIYNTLIELYLDRWQQRPELQAKIMNILQKPGEKCDLNHAMVLCRMHEFWPGLMYIYEEQNL